MINDGYTRAPVITELKIRQVGEINLKGSIMPDGRARFVHNGRAIGFTADSKGRFEASLPVAGAGDVYQFEIEDRGRLVKAEGLLFVPCCGIESAYHLRPGAASLPLGDKVAPIASVDFNGGKALSVEGRVHPSQIVSLFLNGKKVGQTQSDQRGQYQFLIDRTDTSTQVVMIESAKQRHQVTIDLLAHQEAIDAHNAIVATDQAWIINWGLSGGGSQTTYIFKAN